jgi:hypothetical protein
MMRLCSPLLILLLATALQVRALHTYARFHPDEAFYMTFARNAAVNGDWLLGGALDKPPLSIYANAFALSLWGVDQDSAGVLYLVAHKGEFAARVLGVGYGVCLVAVCMAWAYALTQRRRIAYLMGVFVACSPYTLAFAPTAFTDMPLLLGCVSAAYWAARGRPFWAGVCFALACAAKPQAVFWLPLVAISDQPLAISDQRSAISPLAPSPQSSALSPPPSVLRTALHFTLPVLLGMALLGAWDSARPETSVFELGAANNTAQLALVSPALWGERAQQWATWAQWLGGNAFLTIIGILAGRWAWRGKDRRLVLGLWLWGSGYSALHIVTTLNMYDRYLLLALPVWALGAAVGIGRWIPPIQTTPTQITPARTMRTTQVLFLLGGLVLLGSAWSAADGQVLIGSDRGEYTGIDELADYLNAKPVATVIYDRWLGWQMGYYLGQWTNKRRVYYPTPQALAAGAQALNEQGVRYLIAPHDQDLTAWFAALHAVGFTIQLEAHSTPFQVYALIPPPSAE